MAVAMAPFDRARRSRQLLIAGANLTAVAVKSLPSLTMPAASRFDTEPANPLIGPVKRVKTSFVDNGIRGLTSKIAPEKSRSIGVIVSPIPAIRWQPPARQTGTSAPRLA